MPLKMVPFHLLVLVFLINSIRTDDDIAKINVELKQGVLFGKVEKTFWKQKEFYSFKGIPYAEPPVGSLRFQPPKPHQSWEGDLEAFANQPTCMQFCARMRNREPFGLSGSEDCLYVNVFTPKLQGNCPVVAFDYTDDYRTGFNGTDTYSPDFFIEEDVVVVTISHRLGVMGYLTTEDNVIPANNGIRDFILGLQWVKSNIDKFGGDPNRVTLMGNKGAAAMFNIMLYSQKAKGLFSAVIMQSGTALEPTYFFDNTRAKSFELGELLNITTENSETLLQELQKVDAESLVLKEFQVIDSKGIETNQLNPLQFSPIVEEENEDAIITVLPENGKIINDVPVLIGLTSREGLDLSSHFILQPQIFQQVLSEISFTFPIRTGFRFDVNSTVYQINARMDVNEFYYKDGYLNFDSLLEYIVFSGDTLQSYAIDKAAKQLSNELKSPTFYYMFDFRGVLNENCEALAKSAIWGFQNWGATVTDDLCYLHLCTRLKKTYEQMKKLVSEQPEIKVLKKMVRLWTNFIKTNNPTPSKEDDILKGFTWLPINKEDQDVNYLHITKKLKMEKNPLGNRAKFWDAFLDKYSKLAIDGVVKDTETSNDEARVRIGTYFRHQNDVDDDDDEDEVQEVNIEEQIRESMRRGGAREEKEETKTTEEKDTEKKDEYVVDPVKVVDHDEF